jgi:pyruvate formate lyase activating enzyme
MKGAVFNIQHFSVHDGTGIRTVVFLKGCPLRCQWCANPESQSIEPETAWSKAKCIDCGNCLLSHKDAVKYVDERIVPLRKIYSDEAERICLAGAIMVWGEDRSADEIIDIVERDVIFYENSGGGMTLSGGEPLMQMEFTLALLKEAKKRHVHTAMETSGLASYQDLQSAAAYLDQLIYDIKLFDSGKHEEFTGASNKTILANFCRLMSDFPHLPTLVRTPVVPNVNDNTDELRQIVDFVKPYANVSYELLPYHRLGEPKYEALGREYPLGKVSLDNETFKRLKTFVEMGINSEKNY